MRELVLKQGEVVLIDDEDYELVSGHTWHCSRQPNTCYAKTWPSRTLGKRLPIAMHRLIMNAPPGVEVDHINGNGLDNRKENLRLCSHKENSQNKHRRMPGNKGVSWHSRDKKWVAQFWKNGIKYHVGYFTSEDEAVIAYNKAVNDNSRY